ncbi:MAG: DUF5689 domain-containing protein [Bacteroidales bacterium]
MKNLKLKLFSLAFMVVLSGIFTSCNKEDVNDETPFVRLSSQTLSVIQAGGAASFSIESNRAWTISITYTSGSDWIAATPTTGENNGQVALTVLPNTGVAREANIKVATSTTYEYIKIQQAGATAKTYITVAQLRAKGEVTVTDDVYMKASLISDQVGGNSTSKKNIVVSDGAAGIVVRLVNDASTMAVGTELEFKLKDAVLSKYNGLLQLNNFANANMSSTGANVPVAAKAITIAELKANTYESMYVSVPNVQVVNADLTKTMVVGTSHTSINMEAQTGETFVLFNSSYCEFKDVVVPQGSGTIKGIASINNAIIQIQPQNRTDFAALTGARFGNAPTLTYGTPVLAGALNKGTALTASNTITLPYNTATVGQAYSISVAVSGAGSAGITTPATASGTFATAAGNIVITLAGTPSAAGAVVFTITGTGISTPIVLNGTVTDPATTTTMATWTFDAAPTTFPIASSTPSTDASTNASLNLAGFTAPLPTINYTASSKTIYLNTWAQGKAWLFTFTPKQNIASGKTLSITYKGYGSSTSPKNFVVEYSKDNTNWTAMGEVITYTASIASYTRSIALTESLSGQLYIRVKVSTAVAINDGAIADAGNSRLADVVISVN